jgi:cytochrome c oxidase cbb3-type subunit 2
MRHEVIEKRIGLFAVLVAVAISFGGLADIVPLAFSSQSGIPAKGVKPYSALQLEGRDIYQREGCYNCHSQMIRALAAEELRYGPHSLAGESVYDHPFQFGSKRTGPDLARVGMKYSDEWQRVHLLNPRDVVPESNMPAFAWLDKAVLDGTETGAKMAALRKVGVPYTDAEIAAAQSDVEGKTEMQALIAYLQGLGIASKTWGKAP